MRNLPIRTLALSLALGLASAAQAAFVVSPMELHLQLSPGGSGTATVTAGNTGQRPLLLKLYLADSSFDDQGNEEEQPLGALEQSCAPWVTLGAPLLDLAPGETRTAELRFLVPREARGTYWTKLYLEEISQPPPLEREHASRRYQVYIKQRMGVRVFADLPGTALPRAIVETVEARARGRDHDYLVVVANPGRTLLRCTGTIEIRDVHGQTIRILKLGTAGEFVLFPRGRRALAVEGGLELAPGTYTALAVIDYGGDALVAGEAIFDAAGGPFLSDGETRPAGVKETR